MLTYNRAHFLREAINSVLTQSYQNLELIIIDDGSTDATYSVIGEFSDPRIRYIQHTDNQGLTMRRKESLTHAQGVYTAVLDSDDIWTDSEKIEAQIHYMEEHPHCAVIGTFIALIDEYGKTIGNNHYKTTDASIRSHILVRNQFAHSCVLMRTSHIRKTAGYQDFPIGEDLDLFLQLGTVGTFANLPLETTAYRIHTNKASGKRSTVARAVLAIIKKHKDAYPNYLLARIKYSIASW